MEFREMAKEMTDEEIKRCMAILVEDAVIVNIRRDAIQNAIDVVYRMIGDQEDGRYKLSMLPDSVQEMDNMSHLRVDAEHLYKQYLVANGYSLYWMICSCR